MLVVLLLLLLLLLLVVVMMMMMGVCRVCRPEGLSPDQEANIVEVIVRCLLQVDLVSPALLETVLSRMTPGTQVCTAPPIQCTAAFVSPAARHRPSNAAFVSPAVQPVQAVQHLPCVCRSHHA